MRLLRVAFGRLGLGFLAHPCNPCRCLATPVPHVVRVRPPHSTWARYVSYISRVPVLYLLKREHVLAPRLRYLILNLSRTNQTDDLSIIRWQLARSCFMTTC